MNKRAVSPLIATVLLIAFSVALGAVVMNWGTQYVKDTSEDSASNSDVKLACSTGVSLEFIKIDGVTQVYYTNSSNELNISALITNGPTPIEGIKVTVIGNDIEEYIHTEEIGAGDKFKIEANFSVTDMSDFTDSSGEAVRRVEFVPFIKIPDRKTVDYCSDSALSFDYVPSETSLSN